MSTDRIARLSRGALTCSTMPDTLLLRPCTMLRRPSQYVVRWAFKLRTRAAVGLLV
jgi:hypothetical protein